MKTIDNIVLTQLHLTELPDFSDIVVEGVFDCAHNNLVSLKGCPQVKDGFYCEYNKLTSLIGAPKIILRNFFCYRNKLTSLIGAPKYIHGIFDCRLNPIDSLEGCPETVHGNFLISSNNITEQNIRAICHVGKKVYIYSYD